MSVIGMDAPTPAVVPTPKPYPRQWLHDAIMARMSLAQFARTLGVSKSTVWRWIHAEHTPRLGSDTRNAIAAALGWDLAEVNRRFAADRKQGRSRPGAASADLLEIGEPKEDDTNRQQFIVGGLAMGSTLMLDPLERGMARAFDLPSLTVDDWQERATAYGGAYLTTAPAKLVDKLAEDVLIFQETVKVSDDGTARQLCVPGCRLALLMAMCFEFLADKRQARSWWARARSVADASEDRQSRVWVRGLEALNLLYTDWHLPTLGLRRAEEAIFLAEGNLHPGLMNALATRARALAVLGKNVEAMDALIVLERAFDRLPADAVPTNPLAEAITLADIGKWSEGGLRRTQFEVHALLGDVRGAARIEGSARASGTQRHVARVELLNAGILVHGGDIGEGICSAQRVLDGIPLEQQDNAIRRVAERVLNAVPRRELQRPPVVEYRELLASIHRPQKVHTLLSSGG